MTHLALHSPSMLHAHIFIIPLIIWMLVGGSLNKNANFMTFIIFHTKNFNVFLISCKGCVVNAVRKQVELTAEYFLPLGVALSVVLHLTEVDVRTH
jgi:hypothetical protein